MASVLEMDSTSDSIVGNWEFVSIQNSDEIAKSMGLPLEAMKEENYRSEASKLFISKEDQTYTVLSACGHQKTQFTLGETIESPSIAGTEKICVNLIDGKLQETHEYSDGRRMLVEKVVVDDKQYVNFISNGTCIGTILFRRVDGENQCCKQ